MTPPAVPGLVPTSTGCRLPPDIPPPTHTCTICRDGRGTPATPSSVGLSSALTQALSPSKDLQDSPGSSSSPGLPSPPGPGQGSQGHQYSSRRGCRQTAQCICLGDREGTSAAQCHSDDAALVARGSAEAGTARGAGRDQAGTRQELELCLQSHTGQAVCQLLGQAPAPHEGVSQGRTCPGGSPPQRGGWV